MNKFVSSANSLGSKEVALGISFTYKLADLVLTNNFFEFNGDFLSRLGKQLLVPKVHLRMLFYFWLLWKKDFLYNHNISLGYSGVTFMMYLGYIKMFADDTECFCIGDSVDNVTSSLQLLLDDIHTWCRTNFLTINPEKSEILILNRKKLFGPLQGVFLNKKPINYAVKSKCLGMTLDDKVSWKNHVQNVSKCLGQKIKSLRRLKVLHPQFWRAFTSKDFYQVQSMVWLFGAHARTTYCHL